MVPLWIWVAFAFVLGSCVGSFLNVVVWRLPRGESIVRPAGSYCPHCRKPIAWYDNIPLVSWVLLRARCRQCGGRISVRYVLVELASAMLFAGLLAGVYAGPLRGDTGDWPANWPGYVAALVVVSGLLAGSLIDLAHFFIPLAVVWVGGLVSVVLSGVFPGPWLPTGSPATCAWGLGGAVGLAVAMGLLRLGVIPTSFQEEPAGEPKEAAPPTARRKRRIRKKKHERVARRSGLAAPVRPAEQPGQAPVAVSARREVCKELLFILPVAVAGAGWWWIVRSAGPLGPAWQQWCQSDHLRGLGGSLFGLLAGGGLIWLVRIIGTLIAGREAMGLGDVHLLAAAGALVGWGGAVLAFFISPFFGLSAELVVALVRRGRRELPFGPYLSLGVLVVLLFQDRLAARFGPPLETLLSGLL